ncbi:MAG TPA: hypothetical protein VHZ05_00030 [Acidimicrobiales bacterium]|nr:hypothetical protein [Acidimicrobiales bacterium]
MSYTDGDGQAAASDGSTISTTDGSTGTTGNTGTPVDTSPSADSVEQVLAVPILPGPLTVTPTGESVSFTKAHGQGNGGQLAGSLATVTVVDARGSLVGWRATVSLQSVAGVSAADLAKATLCVSPDAPTVVAGNPPEVRAGRTVCGGAGDPLQLFFAPPNGGGGTFSDTGSLTLHLPGVPTADAAAATLAVAAQ